MRRLLSALLPLAVGGCVDDGGVAGPEGPEGAVARLAVVAQLAERPAASVAGGAATRRVGIEVKYVRSDGERRPLGVDPSEVVVPSEPGEYPSPVRVRLGPCLTDPLRAGVGSGGSATAGCSLVVTLTLRDGTGRALDSQESVPPSPAMPGATVTVPSVTLSEVAAVVVTSGAPVAPLVVGEKAQIGVAAHDATGQPVSARTFSWTSSPSGVVTVTPVGDGGSTATITAVGPGAAVVRVSTGGAVGAPGERFVEVPVRVASRVTTIELVTPSAPPAGESLRIAVKGTLGLQARALDAGSAEVADGWAERQVAWSICASDTGPGSVTPACAPVSGISIEPGSGQTAASRLSARVAGSALGASAVAVLTVDGAPPLRVPVTVTAARMTLGPPEPKVAVGKRVTLAAILHDAADAAIPPATPGAAVTWESGHEDVATVDAKTGVVTGLAVGAATIRASGAGVSQSVVVTVTAVATSHRLTIVSDPGSNVEGLVWITDPDPYLGLIDCDTSPDGATSGKCVADLPNGVTVVLAAREDVLYDVTWGGICAGPSFTCTVTITGDHTVRVRFRDRSLRRVTVAAAPAAGGTVSGGGIHPSGAEITVTAAPATGYRFVEWVSDPGGDEGDVVLVSGSPAYTFTVTEDVRLVARFALLSGVVLRRGAIGGSCPACDAGDRPNRTGSFSESQNPRR